MKPTEQDWGFALKTAKQDLEKARRQAIIWQARGDQDQEAYFRFKVKMMRDRVAHIEWHLEQFEVTA